MSESDITGSVAVEYLTCDRCGRDLDVVYRIRLGRQRVGNLVGAATLCEECAEHVRKRRRDLHKRVPWGYPDPPPLCRRKCAGCLHTIVFEANKVPSRRSFCSEACRLRTQRFERNNRGWWLRTCEACGEEFRARRGDAKTCSAKCRKRLQRAATY